MTEKVKRLQPTPETLRELFLKSGNLCAFPNCGHLMMNADGKFIGQVCHIEAAEEGGQRFNRAMTNEDRRHFENLMLMCYEHHVETNDVKSYPVAKMQQIKADHEKRFARPDRAILETLQDWTELDTPTRVTNLRRLDVVQGWKQPKEKLEEAVAELNDYLERLRNVPIGVRRFIGAVAKRAAKMEKMRAVRSDMSGTSVLLSDVAAALNLSKRTVAERANELDAYGLGSLDQLDTDLGFKEAVRIRDLKSGWPLWLDVVLFAQKENLPIEKFTDDLDFSAFDE